MGDKRVNRRIIVNLIRVLAALVVFVTVFALDVRPSWWLIEKLLTRDVSSKQDAGDLGFSVLVRQTKKDNRYAVGYYPDLEEDSELVTEISDHDIAAVNRDLRVSVSDQRSDYIYFRVLRRGEGYTDVQLETPTTADFWFKDSYRIKSGNAYLLRTMGFSPMFGLMVATLPILTGVVAIICGERLLKRLGVVVS
ncbi:MAG: hypothetical protein WBV46_01510 [Terriglobales bacterium]|jgi:hypothetical protein